MNYCPNCGAYIPDGATKCVACGYDTEEKEKNTQTQYGFGSGAAQAAPQPGRDRQRDEQQGEQRQSYTGTVIDDEPRQERSRSYYYDPIAEDANKNRGLGILCYIGPLFLFPLLTRRNSPYIRYHANQGLALFIAEIVINICYTIPVIGWLVGTVGGILALISFISGIANAANGRMKPIPFFGGINLIK